MRERTSALDRRLISLRILRSEGPAINICSLPTIATDDVEHPTMALLTVFEPRSVTLVPTATSGVPASHTSGSISRGPTPTVTFKSQKQAKAPVGLIVGVAIAVIAAIAVLFFIRYLFIRRARRREVSSKTAQMPQHSQIPQSRAAHSPPQRPPPQSQSHLPPSDRDAVELAQYPPPGAGHSASGSWSTPFAPASTAEPGASSSPAARQAYIAAELRAAQSLLERGGKGINATKIKARIRELEERQNSAWALGLE
ncbi:hypothetical protein DFH07DRAFT_307641 [Mycena maculata]|uniref:Uncharacterized protein n=1 Tax=Mycena maculata TaxID=230809 RepID=A0AAD7HHS2_9AGAR|nr:hypothetical protein DFH07DRAFT_307641 [Mycena maculata]